MVLDIIRESLRPDLEGNLSRLGPTWASCFLVLSHKWTAIVFCFFGLVLQVCAAETDAYAQTGNPDRSRKNHEQPFAMLVFDSNRCLAVTNRQLRAVRCNEGDTAQNWVNRVIVGSKELLQLQNVLTGECLGSEIIDHRVDIALLPCGPSRPETHWKFSDASPEHQYVINGKHGFCLSSRSDRSPEVPSLEACSVGHRSQQWVRLDLPIRIYSWNPNITNDCYIFNDYEKNGWWRRPSVLSSMCEAKTDLPQAWVIASYNEGVPNKYPPGDIIPPSKIGKEKLWNFQFLPTQDGTFSLLMELDKLNQPDYLDQFTWVGIQDSFDRNRSIPRPDLTDNLYIDLKIAVHHASRGINDNVSREVSPKEFWEIGKGRVHLGVMLRWESMEPTFRVRETYNIEIVFWRDPEYDGCKANANWWGPPSHALTTPCDLSDVYDRRAAWGDPNTGHGGGEAVYYTASGVQATLGYSLPMASPNGQFFTYRIPISKLVKDYHWKRPPPSWSNVKVAGVYIGAEAWGKSKVIFEIKDYRLYALPSTIKTSLEK